MAQTQGGAGCKKYAHSAKKAEGKNHPVSLFVRGKISATEYFRQTNQK